jgi:hypothetical protein
MMSSTDGVFMFSCVIRTGLPMNVSGLEGDEETLVPM